MSAQPAAMLAQPWDSTSSPTGWWMSEKYDGVRALWDGTVLRTRNGNIIAAPESLLRHLPALPLDGELWLGRGRFQQTAGIVRSKDGRPAWDAIRYIVFDAPTVPGSFEHRQATLSEAVSPTNPRVVIADQQRCKGRAHLDDTMQALVDDGAEGVMLRRAGSAYEPRRSPALRKLKYTADIDGVVVGYEDGKGRNAGLVGALVVSVQGQPIRVGSGLDDDTRLDPPPLGATVTIAHSGFTQAGMLREPRFVGQRADCLLQVAA